MTIVIHICAHNQIVMFYPLTYRMFHNYCNIFFEQIFWMSIWVHLIQHLLCGSITYHKAVCQYHICSWWRHQMETFSALLAFGAGNSPVSGKFPAQRPVARSFDVFFDLRLNQRLSKQPWGWWYETPSRPLWRHRNGYFHSSSYRLFIVRHDFGCFGLIYHFMARVNFICSAVSL